MIPPTGQQWQIILGDALLRQGSRSDRMALTWLLMASQRLHRSEGLESPEMLLLQEGGFVWLRGRTMRGALLCSLYRAPVARASVLALRHVADQELFFNHILPLIEVRLAALGARWLCFVGDEDWLIPELARRGYEALAQVVAYRKRTLAGEMDVMGDGGVQVRAAAPHEVGEILAVDAAAFEPFWRVNAAIIRQGLQPAAALLVAVQEEHVVGYLLAHTWRRAAYVSRLGVLPSWQQQGIGRRLLCEALAMLARDGVREVRLNTQQDNHQARRLYEQLGFERIGEPLPYWAKPLAAVAADESQAL